jgi:uncharacterized protein (TIGR02453 family)
MHIKDLSRYLFELSENNNRAWFVMNKPRYDILRAEFVQFVSDLIIGVSKFDPAIAACDPKKAIFRINRDVRFSNDKSPYKTTFSAALIPNGKKKPSEGGGPAYYFQLDAKGRVFFALGEYIPPADRVKQIRNHMVNDTDGFIKVFKNKALKATFGSELQVEAKLARPPKGFDPEHPLIEQIKLKSFMIWTEQPTANLDSDQVLAVLTKGFKDGFPLVAWLRTAG